VQLTLDQARKPHGRGGWRPGSGRPKGRTRVAHEAREEFAQAHPQHVTLRIVDDLPSLRRECFVKTIRDAIARSHRVGFRVVHFNVEPNHLHLITEASSKQSHARGLQGLEVRISRQINKQLGRTGSLFDDHYHSRALESPREVRNALRYVLNNARHHAAERGDTITAAWALAMRGSGRIPLYSTSWMNTASLAVARKLGLVAYASDWSIAY
jgi:REP element-mobilizing transposase RayT